jgi:uncharacterized protein YqeY
MDESMGDRLKADMIQAMKAKDKERLTVLRMLIAKLKDAAIDKRDVLSAEEELRLIATYAKQREEGLAEAEKAGRADLAEKERFELQLVRSYLPEPLDEAQLGTLVEEVIAETGASSMKDMGAVMKAVLARAAGRADGGKVSAIVKSKLAG